MEGWLPVAEVRPPYAHLPAAWNALAGQHVARQQNFEAKRAEATYVRTPAPVYSRPDVAVVGPDRREQTEGARIGAAICAARRLYPGVVAEVLVDALSWHQSTPSRVSGTSLPARLVDELLRR